MIREQIEQDLKTAMLAGDKQRVDTLKGIKSAIQYAEVEARSKGQTLDEPQVLVVLQKEAKKRAESAELYQSGNAADRAGNELAEKAIIDTYLPAQLTEAELTQLIQDIAGSMGGVTQQTMGPIIGAVKAKAGAGGDGGTIARLVKEQLG